MVLLGIYFTVKKFLLHVCIESILYDAGIILSASSVLALLVFIINKYGMHLGIHNLLGLADVRGRYIGELISSYYIDDNQDKGHVRVNCEIEITQNLNGYQVNGKFYKTDPFNPSSSFKTIWSDIIPAEGGFADLVYSYVNVPNMGDKDFEQLKNNKHEGFCELSFNIKKRTLEGYYFNNERNSYGQLYLKDSIT